MIKWRFNPNFKVGEEEIKVIENIEASNVNSGIYIIPTKIQNTLSKKIMLELRIQSKNEDSPVTVVEIGLMNLSKGILDLREYGFMLQRNDATGIAQEIEKNFNSFKTKNVDGVVRWTYGDEVFNAVIETIAEYILETPIEIEKSDRLRIASGLYLISTKEFKELLKDSQYDCLDVSALKWELLNKGYTYCNRGRNDYQKSTEATRFLAFIDSNVLAEKIENVKSRAETEKIEAKR